ncbi:Aste57867_8984 [Aphanomyces stellatus]|uniref:Aste57867_8984 protein n=1 Tax=Aphanomyces stellatus TaxID=120398 RepID=A0A485KLV4_9STRA|nr:hypothetical protein As57867_008949 [Aphanomyces stellatus]VFT85868.1 Aste57867_8984 [Aphanomyces stellatus]
MADGLSILVSAPYGHTAVDVPTYDEVILIAGGIGITPMLNLVNQARLLGDASKKIHLHWAVRHPDELLCADSLMFSSPFPDNVHAKFYASSAPEAGSVMSETGDQVTFFRGRPNMDEILNNSQQFMGKRVCVLACGPPAMVRDAQIQARSVGLDFHKEVFLL